jgi:hypothetical protein
LLALAGACTGPVLHLHNPDGHLVFIDGVATAQDALPFRYYGATRWDALPRDRDGRADWDHLPSSGVVAMPAPVSPWLFPLDLPLELLARLADGRADATARIAVTARPADPRSEREFTSAEAVAIADRARSARVAR